MSKCWVRGLGYGAGLIAVGGAKDGWGLVARMGAGLEAVGRACWCVGGARIEGRGLSEWCWVRGVGLEMGGAMSG